MGKGGDDPCRHLLIAYDDKQPSTGPGATREIPPSVATHGIELGMIGGRHGLEYRVDK